MKKFLLVLLGCITMAGCGEAKVTDPNDPRFDPDKFSFRDYGEDKEMTLHEAYQRLFPPGTSKEFVERVLVGAGGVEKYGCLKYHNRCSYYYPRYMQDLKGGARTTFIFDSDNKLLVGSGQSAEDFREISKQHSKVIDEKIRNGEFNDR